MRFAIRRSFPMVAVLACLASIAATGCASSLHISEEAMTELPLPDQDLATGQWGYRDRDGAWELLPTYAHAEPFTAGGIAAVADGQGWRYVDRTGRTVVARPWIVDNAPDAFHEGLARAIDDDGFVYFDERGREVLHVPYAYAEPFAGGLALVCDGCLPEQVGEHRRWVDGRWGYVDHDGKAVIPCQYDEGTSFEDGFARVKRGESWLTIDPAGREIPQ